jgi:drug/metabolite transporter (DMT)-like permease
MSLRHPGCVKLAAALATVYVVWGSTYLGIAVAERTLPPLLMLSLRFTVAGALLWAWSARRGTPRPSRRQWLGAAVVGGLLLVVDTGLLALAEKRIATGVAALLIASVPLFMTMIERVAFGTRIPGGAALGIATGLVGVGLLAGGGGAVDPLGAVALLVAALAWAAGSAYARVASLPRSPVLAAAMQMLCAGVMLGVAGAVSGELGRVHLDAVSPASLGALAYLVVFGSLIAFTAYGWLLKNASTPVLSTYAYVNPAVAVFLGWLFASERLGARELVSGFIVLTSVMLLLFAREPRSEPAPVPDSLPPYIRAKEAQVVDFPRPVPHLVDLRRIAA